MTPRRSRWSALAGGALAVEALAATLAAQAPAPAVSPRLPSVRVYGSLNEVPPPATTAEWTFEASRLDMVHGGDHWRVLRTLPYPPDYLRYELLTTVLDGSPEERSVATSCGSTAGGGEAAFLHFAEPTEIEGKGGTRERITAASVAAGDRSSGMRAFVWSSWRRILNLRQACVQDWLVARARSAMDDRGHGVMYDEIGPPDSPGEAGPYPRALEGGGVREFGGLTSRAWIASGGHARAMELVLTRIRRALQSAPRPGEVLVNTAEYLTPGVEQLGLASSGLLTEHLVDERARYSGSGEAALWRLAGRMAAAGRFLVLAEGDTGAPRDPTFTAGNYRSRHDRHAMYALTSYWMGAELPWTLFTQRPRWAPLSSYWVRAQEADLGRPQGPFRSWRSGATARDAAGQQWTVWRRDFERAVVLFRTRVSWEAADNRDFGATTPLLELETPRCLLNPDGSLGPPIRQIALSRSEGVTLLDCPSDR